MNAFVGPGTGALPRAPGRRRCAARACAAELLVMRSNGGVASAPRRAERPVTLMLSGPAAGVLGAQLGRRARRAPPLDHVRHGRHLARTSAIVTEAGVNEASARDTGSPATRCWCRCSTSRRSARAAARSPTSTRPAGSASARAARAPSPGPACYGLGGEEPTITDANVVLGRLDPDALPRRRDGARPRPRARGRRRARASASGSDPREAAEGVVDLANANMAQTRSARITVESGHDPRDFSAGRLRRRGPAPRGRARRGARDPRGLIPPYPGITSATGLLTSDLRYDQMRTVFMVEGAVDGDAARPRARRARGRARARRLRRDGVAADGRRGRAVLDCRYVGQGYELRCPRARGPGDDAASAAFHAAHRASTGTRSATRSRSSTCASRPRAAAEARARRRRAGHGAPRRRPVATSRPGASTASWSSCRRRTRPRARCGAGEPVAGPAIVCSATPPSPSRRDWAADGDAGVASCVLTHDGGTRS